MITSIILASLGTARNKARAAKIEVEILQLKNAFELYAANNNGKYPFEDDLAWFEEPISEVHPSIINYLRTFPAHSSTGEDYYITDTSPVSGMGAYPCDGRIFKKYMYIFHNDVYELNIPEIDGLPDYYCIGS